MNVAIIEDNADNRLLVSALIDGQHELTEYETGPAALEAFARRLPDVVLLDLSLPGMDGTEVLRRLKADPHTSAVPVIALTAHAMAGDREKYLAEGFDDYVAKPIVDERVLFDALQGALARHAAAR